MNGIRATLGAALAEDAIGGVREFETRIARALDALTGGPEEVTAESDRAAASLAA